MVLRAGCWPQAGSSLPRWCSAPRSTRPTTPHQQMGAGACEEDKHEAAAPAGCQAKSTNQPHGTQQEPTARPGAAVPPCPPCSKGRPGDALKPGLAQPWTLNRTPPLVYTAACMPQRMSRHSLREQPGQAHTALHVHWHHPELRSVPPAHSQPFPSVSAVQHRDSQGLGDPIQRPTSWSPQ